MARARRARTINVGNILAQYGERAAQAAKQALAENAEALAEEAKRRCPVDTGNLRDSIHVEIQNNGTRAKIVADATDEKGYPYGAIVEFAPYDKGGRPFLHPAFRAKRDELKQNVIDKVRAAVNQG